MAKFESDPDLAYLSIIYLPSPQTLKFRKVPVGTNQKWYSNRIQIWVQFENFSNSNSNEFGLNLKFFQIQIWVKFEIKFFIKVFKIWSNFFSVFTTFFWFDHKKYFCNTFLCKFLAKSWSSRTCVRDRFFLNFKQFSSFFLQCSTGTHMCGAGTPTFRTSAKMQSVSFFVRHRSFFKGAKNREIQKTEKMDLRHLLFWGCLKSAIFGGKPMPTRPP